jgi:hypothetical protein
VYELEYPIFEFARSSNETEASHRIVIDKSAQIECDTTVETVALKEVKGECE